MDQDYKLSLLQQMLKLPEAKDTMASMELLADKIIPLIPQELKEAWIALPYEQATVEVKRWLIDFFGIDEELKAELYKTHNL